MSQLTWLTGIAMHGRDRIPTYICISGMRCPRYTPRKRFVNQNDIKIVMEAASHDSDTLLYFKNSISKVTKALTKELAVASALMPMAEEFDRLRVVRWQAERK